MKIFFSASRQGKQYFDFYYQQIFTFLQQEGYENTNRELMEKDNKKYYQELKRHGQKGYSILHKSLIDKLQQSDVCVVECSFQSITIGYLIDKTLELGKPVIALYLREHEPEFLMGLENEKFQLIEYTKETLLLKLRSAIQKAGFQMDKRFNFFISPGLLTYLNKISRKRGITKSTFIRNLILENMKKEA